MATAVGYVFLAVLTARRFGGAQVVALALLVPAAICGVYAFVVDAGNTSKVGFSSGLLMSFAVVCLAAAATSVALTISSARR